MLAVAQTTNATPLQVWSYTLAAGEIITVMVDINAAYADGSSIYHANTLNGCRRQTNGATPVRTGTSGGSPLAVANNFGGAITFAVSGNAFTISVTGVAATTIKWSLVVTRNSVIL